MGVVIGIAAVLGVQAGRHEYLELGLLLAAALGAIAFLTSSASSRFLTLSSLAVAIGFLVGSGRTVETDAQSIQSVPLDEPLLVEVASDARVAGRGWAADVRIESPASNAHQREYFAFFPRSFRPAPGQVVAVASEMPAERPDLMFVERARLVEREGWSERVRQRVRSGLESRVQAAVPGSAGTLALGLLIGDDSALTTVEREDLRRSGLSHITTVSGWNVTIIVGLVAMMFGAFGKTGLGWICLQVLAIAGYVWIVGVEPPIVRAAIMGSLALVATVPGRPTHLLTLLSLSAAMMVVVDPNVMSSLAFQLSFLSMIGLVIAAKLNPYERGMRRVAVDTIAVPAMAALMTMPLIATRFGMASATTIPANIIVSPLVTPLAAAGALAALLEPLWYAEMLPAMIAWLVGSLILMTSAGAANAGLGVWEFDPPGVATVVAFYMFVLALFAPVVGELGWLARFAEERFRLAPRSALLACSSAAAVLAAGGLLAI